MMEITPLAIMAITGCGLCFAASDFVRKQASVYCSPALLIAVVFTAIIPIFLVLLLTSGPVSFSAQYIVPGGLNILANVLANVFLIRAVAVSDLSRTIPLLSLTPVFTALLGWVMLGEALHGQQWAGISLVVVGVLWLYVPADKGSIFGFSSIVQNFVQEKGAKYMCLVALFWTLAPTFERVALRYASIPLHGFIHFSCAALVLWLWLFFKGNLSKAALPEKSGWKVIGVLALLYAGALGLQMLSLKLVFVGIMEAVKRVIGQISAVVLGRIIFNEPITRPKVFGIAFMCAGVPFIIVPNIF
jgi:uncharacterized membrane protein